MAGRYFQSVGKIIFQNKRNRPTQRNELETTNGSDVSHQFGVVCYRNVDFDDARKSAV